MKIAVLFLSFVVCSAFAARVEVEVEGMSCGMCVEHITKQLKSTDKAENISVSLEDKRTRFSEVKGKRLSDAEIRSAIKKAGYEATKITRKN